MQLCLIFTVAHTCSALLIAIDNINTAREIGLLTINMTYKDTHDSPSLCVLRCRCSALCLDEGRNVLSVTMYRAVR